MDHWLLGLIAFAVTIASQGDPVFAGEAKCRLIMSRSDHLKKVSVVAVGTDGRVIWAKPLGPKFGTPRLKLLKDGRVVVLGYGIRLPDYMILDPRGRMLDQGPRLVQGLGYLQDIDDLGTHLYAHWVTERIPIRPDRALTREQNILNASNEVLLHVELVATTAGGAPRKVAHVPAEIFNGDSRPRFKWGDHGEFWAIAFFGNRVGRFDPKGKPLLVLELERVACLRAMPGGEFLVLEKATPVVAEQRPGRGDRDYIRRCDSRGAMIDSFATKDQINSFHVLPHGGLAVRYRDRIDLVDGDGRTTHTEKASQVWDFVLPIGPVGPGAL